MDYFSTNRGSPNVSFRDAVINGQPPGGGLYFPAEIPRIPQTFWDEYRDLPNSEIAFRVIGPYLGGSIPEIELRTICSRAVEFPFPLVQVSERITALELFHGPTLAFKDVGARFMSGCLEYFKKDDYQKTLVIVATSGDTGGAVAAGFHGLKDIEVVILYPEGRVSRVQELQLTTLGQNVTALKVRGSFDDCQSMAKAALADGDLRAKAKLTSANSINVARWLPQQFYYFFALKQWQYAAPIFSVPSGNFGNIAAGLLAAHSGLPVKRFIAACNANDTVPRFLRTGNYVPKPSVSTLSNAMDVGDPSNFVRLSALLGEMPSDLSAQLDAVSVSDGTTTAAIRDVYAKYRYILDPHGAVAYHALEEYLAEHPDEHGIFLETAHPVKFETVGSILGFEPEMPETVTELFSKQENSISIPADQNIFREIVLSKI